MLRQAGFFAARLAEALDLAIGKPHSLECAGKLIMRLGIGSVIAAATMATAFASVTKPKVRLTTPPFFRSIVEQALGTQI
jgi:hypothetical protein